MHFDGVIWMTVAPQFLKSWLIACIDIKRFLLCCGIWTREPGNVFRSSELSTWHIFCHSAVIPLTLFSPQAVPSWTWAGSGMSDPKSKSEDQHRTPDALLTTLQAGRFWRLTDVHWSFPHRLCLHGMKDTQRQGEQIKISSSANPCQPFSLHFKKYILLNLSL